MITYIAIFIVFFILAWQYAKRRKRESIPPWIKRGMSEDEWYDSAEELTKAGIFTKNPYPRPYKKPKKIESANESYWEPMTSQDVLRSIRLGIEQSSRPGNPYKDLIKREQS
jgi:hypothetical protein